MAEVTVRYRGGLAEIVGTGSEQLQAATVAELLRRLKSLHGKQAHKSAKAMIIAVNGVSILKRRVFATELSDGDVVSFLPLAAGG